MRPLFFFGIILTFLSIGSVASEYEGGQAYENEQSVRNSIVLGAFAFADNCRKCHDTDGYGSKGLYPSLHRPELLANKELLIKTILHGRVGLKEDGTELRLMPALDYLTNHEIATIIAFITSSWGDEVMRVTEEEVNAAR